MEKLLTRENFRRHVFLRDSHLCVNCKDSGVDTHHLIERRLWSDGGYYLSNGVTLCPSCHIKAESTELGVEYLRDCAGIVRVIVPQHLYPDQPYTKWGDPILPNGMRMKGELFQDDSVQKAIAPYINLYTTYVKYPRTYHLPWSDGVTSDDKVMDIADFNNVVITEKMDGENTTMYRDYIHARSLDNSTGRSFVKNLWSKIAYNIPDSWRVCGENLYAKHSIKYDKLEAYFLGFSVWDDSNICLSWDETIEYLALLDIKPVKILYRGPLSEISHYELWNLSLYDKMEGYVIRNSDSFHYKDFRFNVGKYVRPDHVKTSKHWIRQGELEVNSLI